MLIPSYTKQFAKDLKRMLKRGKSKDKIKEVIKELIIKERLESRYRDHRLIGNYKGRRECHVEPDWLLFTKQCKEKSFLKEQAPMLIFLNNELPANQALIVPR